MGVRINNSFAQRSGIHHPGQVQVWARQQGAAELPSAKQTTTRIPRKSAADPDPAWSI